MWQNFTYLPTHAPVIIDDCYEIRYRAAVGYYRQHIHSSFSVTVAKCDITRRGTIIGYCGKILLTSFQLLTVAVRDLIRLRQQ